MMRGKGHRVGSFVAIGFSFFLLAVTGAGCGPSIADGYWVSGSYDSCCVTTTTIDTWNKLVVSGGGDVLAFEYNSLGFEALLDYDSGLYFFAPDPDGLITGDKIVCTALVSDTDVEGDCFRLGEVCQFDFWYEVTTPDGMSDIYSLGVSSCRDAGDVGPFLVPLGSPLCGEDPFPPCL